MYIPPEVITGTERRKISYNIDLYALGKCLYRAFTANSPDRFPTVAPDILMDKYGKVFNRLVKSACSPKEGSRLRDITTFRLLLNDSLDLKTQIWIKFSPYFVFTLYFMRQLFNCFIRFNGRIRWAYYIASIIVFCFFLKCIFLYSIESMKSKERRAHHTFWHLVVSETPIKIRNMCKFVFSSDYRRKERERPIRAKLSGTIDRRMGLGVSIGGENHTRVIEASLPSMSQLQGAPRRSEVIYQSPSDKGDGWKCEW